MFLFVLEGIFFGKVQILDCVVIYHGDVEMIDSLDS